MLPYIYTLTLTKYPRLATETEMLGAIGIYIKCASANAPFPVYPYKLHTNGSKCFRPLFSYKLMFTKYFYNFMTCVNLSVSRSVYICTEQTMHTKNTLTSHGGNKGPYKPFARGR